MLSQNEELRRVQDDQDRINLDGIRKRFDLNTMSQISDIYIKLEKYASDQVNDLFNLRTHAGNK